MTRGLLVSAESMVFSIIQVQGVTVAGKPGMEGWNPSIEHIFNVFLDTGQHVFYFLTAKFMELWLVGFFFSKITPFPT